MQEADDVHVLLAVATGLGARLNRGNTAEPVTASSAMLQLPSAELCQ